MKTLNLDNLSIDNVMLLNEISISIIEDYNALIGSIFDATDKSIDWLVSSTLSRHPYLNPLFINLCYLKLVDFLVENDKDFGKVIVVDANLKEVIEEKCKRDGIKIQVSVLTDKAGIKERLRNDFRPMVDFYHSSKRLILMCLLSSKSRKIAMKKDRPIAVIDMFFFSINVQEQQILR